MIQTSPGQLIAKKIAAKVKSEMEGMDVPRKGPISSPTPPFSYCSGLEITLKKGGVTSVKVSTPKVTEPSKNKFDIEMDTPFGITYREWYETYDFCPPRGKPQSEKCDCGKFHFSFSKFEFTLHVDLTGSKPEVTCTTPVKSGLKFKVPSKSVLTGALFPSVKKKVRDGISDAIEKFDFKKEIEKAAKEALGG